MHRPPSETLNGSAHAKSADVIIPSDPDEARRVQAEIEEHLKSNSYSERDIFGIKLALEEAFTGSNTLEPDMRKPLFIVHDTGDGFV